MWLKTVCHSQSQPRLKSSECVWRKTGQNNIFSAQKYSPYSCYETCCFWLALFSFSLVCVCLCVRTLVEDDDGCLEQWQGADFAPWVWALVWHTGVCVCVCVIVEVTCVSPCSHSMPIRDKVFFLYLLYVFPSGPVCLRAAHESHILPHLSRHLWPEIYIHTLNVKIRFMKSVAYLLYW